MNQIEIGDIVVINNPDHNRYGRAGMARYITGGWATIDLANGERLTTSVRFLDRETTS